MSAAIHSVDAGLVAIVSTGMGDEVHGAAVRRVEVGERSLGDFRTVVPACPGLHDGFHSGGSTPVARIEGRAFIGDRIVGRTVQVHDGNRL